MNTTQRKYAISRLTELAKNAFAKIIADEELIAKGYEDLYVIDVREIDCGLIKNVFVGPHTKLSDVFDLSDQIETLKTVREAYLETHEKGNYPVTLPWHKESYYQPTVKFKDTYLRTKKLLSELQSACDTIMLGDSEQATSAIAAFENKSF